MNLLAEDDSSRRPSPDELLLVFDALLASCTLVLLLIRRRRTVSSVSAYEDLGASYTDNLARDKESASFVCLDMARRVSSRGGSAANVPCAVALEDVHGRQRHVARPLCYELSLGRARRSVPVPVGTAEGFQDGCVRSPATRPGDPRPTTHRLEGGWARSSFVARRSA